MLNISIPDDLVYMYIFRLVYKALQFSKVISLTYALVVVCENSSLFNHSD